MIRNLTSLRFIFIFLIFISHVGYVGVPQFDFGGESGVSFFFVLSGFLLARRYGGDIECGTFRHKHFVWHQLSKFYPLHVAVLVLSVLLEYRSVDALYLLKSFSALLLVQSWVPDTSWFWTGNAVAWFLSDILFMYAVFPLIYRLVHGEKRWLALVALTVLIFYVVYLHFVPACRYNELVYAPPLLRCIDFALGVYASGVTVRVGNVGKAYLLETTAVAVGIATFAIYPQIDVRYHCAMLLWPMSVITVIVFAATDKQGTLLTRLLHCSALVFCGSMSYEYYLLHPQCSWNTYVILRKTGLTDRLPVFVVVLMCLAVTLSASWLAKKCFVDKASVYMEKRQWKKISEE